MSRPQLKRNISSQSIKWSEDDQLAREYAKRQEEIVLWIEKTLNIKLDSHDLQTSLKSGIILRDLMDVISPEKNTGCRRPICRQYSQTMAPWKERENISIFLSDCKSLGMSDMSLFSPDDLYEGTNMIQVIFALRYLAEYLDPNKEKTRATVMPLLKTKYGLNRELSMYNKMCAIDETNDEVPHTAIHNNNVQTADIHLRESNLNTGKTEFSIKSVVENDSYKPKPTTSRVNPHPSCCNEPKSETKFSQHTMENCISNQQELISGSTDSKYSDKCQDTFCVGERDSANSNIETFDITKKDTLNADHNSVKVHTDNSSEPRGIDSEFVENRRKCSSSASTITNDVFDERIDASCCAKTQCNLL